MLLRHVTRKPGSHNPFSVANPTEGRQLILSRRPLDCDMMKRSQHDHQHEGCWILLPILRHCSALPRASPSSKWNTSWLASHARARCTSCSSKGKKCVPSTSVLAVWSRVCVDCRKDLAKHSCQLLLFCKILLRVMTLGNILSPLPGLCWRRTLVSEKNAADISLRSLSGAGWSRPVLLSSKRWHGTVHWTNTCLVFIIIPHIHCCN